VLWTCNRRRGPDITHITSRALDQAYTRHLELFIDDAPSNLTELGYAGGLEAYADGTRMSGQLIVPIDRSQDGAYAVH